MALHRVLQPDAPTRSRGFSALAYGRRNSEEPEMSTDTTTDLPEMTKKLEAVPAATARPSVLIQPGGAIPIIRPPRPPSVYTFAGRKIFATPR